MARGRKTLNRMDYRGDFDEEGEPKQQEEEKDEDEEEEGDDDDEGAEEEGEPEADVDDEGAGDDDEDAPKKPKKKAAKKKAPATKRTRAPKVVRMKAVWIVYDNSSKQLETFPFSEKKEAETYVEQKNTPDRKGACYLQLVKIPYDEK